MPIHLFRHPGLRAGCSGYQATAPCGPSSWRHRWWSCCRSGPACRCDWKTEPRVRATPPYEMAMCDSLYIFSSILPFLTLCWLQLQLRRPPSLRDGLSPHASAVDSPPTPWRAGGKWPWWRVRPPPTSAPPTESPVQESCWSRAAGPASALWTEPHNRKEKCKNDVEEKGKDRVRQRGGENQT